MNPAASAGASTPPRIFTLTGNLLAERTLEFAAWAPGRTQRAVAGTFQVGGKGINVAKMLNRLQVPNTALCFIGGAPGNECAAWLREHHFDHRAFATATPTRCGTVVRARTGTPAETTFLGPDAAPDAAAVLACADFLDAQPAGAVLALCGSFPGWPTESFAPLRAAILRWISRGPVVVDSYGPPLVWLAQHPVALVKINADELRALTNDAPPPLPPAVRNWVVTDGPRAVTVTTANGHFSFTPPPVHEVSATGSGDVLLACILAGYFCRGLTLAESVAFALPFAAANAAHPGIAEFDLPTTVA